MEKILGFLAKVESISVIVTVAGGQQYDISNTRIGGEGTITALECVTNGLETGDNGLFSNTLLIPFSDEAAEEQVTALEPSRNIPPNMVLVDRELFAKMTAANAIQAKVAAE